MQLYNTFGFNNTKILMGEEMNGEVIHIFLMLLILALMFFILKSPKKSNDKNGDE